MSTAVQPTLALGGRFAHELPELAIAWQAEEAPDPRLLVLNEALAQELGLDPASLRGPEGVRLLIGNHVPEGATPVAQGYAGHQFGSYSPRLGDGRALLLGEVTDAYGRLRDIHLKGSGRTPFARGGDGLAAIGPMLREYLISEAMHALGVPTTRSLAVVATGRWIRRDTQMPGAVLARVASSHLRVGSFQYARAMDDVGLLRRLADHAINRHHPGAATAERPYLALFDAVVAAQAALVAQWMLVGFVHGVMNTDNMTISGETIDYGPCAFMDAFDPAAVYSSIDSAGRYAYRNQPVLAEWNLARLAEALLPLLDEDEDKAVNLAMESLKTFRTRYSDAWLAGMKAKIGLAGDDGAAGASRRTEQPGHAEADAGDPQEPRDDGAAGLVDELVAILQEGRVDYTSFFRALGSAARGHDGAARGLFADPARFGAWVERWRALRPDADAVDRVNPAYIPRNHLVEEALAAATNGDTDPFMRLLDVVQEPYLERPGLERYAEPAPEDFGPYRTFCGT